MKFIPLTKGRFAIVDDSDFNRVNQFYWQTKIDGRNTYAMRSIVRNGKRTTERMHNFILGKTKVDHKDRNGLNNRKSNLRPATKTQNGWNRGINKNTSSGFKGVHFSKHHKKFHARICWLGERIGLGVYKTAREASKAYDAAANFLFKEFSATNQELCH